jgi:hypothetical protein
MDQAQTCMTPCRPGRPQVLHVPHAEPLACGFVHVADGQPAVAAALARTVPSRADNLGQCSTGTVRIERLMLTLDILCREST